MDQCAQVVLVGEFQRRVVLEQPGDGEFERTPGVEAGSPRVGIRRCFCLEGRFKDGRPFGLEKAKMGHRKSRYTRE